VNAKTSRGSSSYLFLREKDSELLVSHSRISNDHEENNFDDVRVCFGWWGRFACWEMRTSITSTGCSTS